MMISASSVCLALMTLGATGPDARVALVMEQRVDGRTVARSPAASALTERMIAAGVVFVDEAQARKIRSAIDAKTLVEGKVSQVVTSLDADLLVVGVADAQRRAGMFGKRVAYYETVIEARLLAVSTGRVLASLSVREKARSMEPERAVDKSARAAAETLAKQLLERMGSAKAQRRIELLISGLPNIRRAAQIGQALQKLEGISKVRELAISTKTSKLELTSSKDARAIAFEIEDAPALGLSVYGFTKGRIDAAFAAHRAASVPVVVGRFAPRAGAADWRADALAQILETALLDSAPLRVYRQARPVSLSRSRERQRAVLRELDLPQGRTVFVLGQYQARGAKVRISVEVVAAGSGGTLLAKQVVCEQRELSGCATQLADTIAKQTPAAIERKRHLFSGAIKRGELTRSTRSNGSNSSATRKRALQVVEISAKDLYPSRALAYARRALAQVELKNRGKRKLSDLVVIADVPGLTKSPLRTAPTSLAPRAKLSVPLPLVLDVEALSTLEEHRPSVLTIEVEYTEGDYRFVERASRPLLAYSKRAHGWDEPEAIAAFVTHRDPAIQARAKAAISAIPEALQGHLAAQPAALFAAIKRLRYTADPKDPFDGANIDYVLYPAETFQAGGGDCDDLSVVYAALAEAVGLRALIVLMPGHQLVAVDSGLLARNAALWKDELLEHEGRAYIPIETTLADRSFEEAWRSAVKRLKGQRPQIVSVRSAWRRFGPALLSKSKPELRLSRDQLTQQIQRSVQAVEAARQQKLQKAMKKAERRMVAKTARWHQLNALALLQVEAKQMSEARASLERAVKIAPKETVPINNLGNVQLLSGSAKEALETYQRALARAPKKAPIHLNAALAAWRQGDEDSFTKHVSQCLLLGGETPVRQLLESLGEPGTVRSEAPTEQNRGDLARALQAALKRQGLAQPKATVRAERGASVPLERFVFWLRAT